MRRRKEGVAAGAATLQDGWAETGTEGAEPETLGVGVVVEWGGGGCASRW